MRCPEEENVNLAVYMLQERADCWWQSLQRTVFSEREDFISWEKFLEVFKEKYFFDHVQEMKEQEFADLVQGALTVAEYEAKFSALGRYAPHIFDNPRRTLKKFVDGLRGSIRRYIGTNDPETFTKAFRVAHLAERENDRFMDKQKRAGKRPMPTLAYPQKGK